MAAIINRRVALCLVGALTLVLTLFVGWKPFVERFRALPAQDLVYYFTAYQLFAAGENPYDTVRQNELLEQLALPEPPDRVNLMYPPWLLPLFAPVLSFSLQQAKALLVIINVLCLAAIPIVLAFAVRPRGRVLHPSLLFAALYVPAFETIRLGQVILLTTTALALTMLAIAKGRDLLAGAMLAVVGIKPHLVVPFGLVLIYWIVLERRWKIPVAAVVTVALLSLIAHLVSPGIVGHWIANSREVSDTFTIFKTATLTFAARSLLIGEDGTPPNWPLIVFPALAASATVIHLAIRRPRIELARAAPLMLIVSVLFAPYAWYHDHTVLLVAQALMILLLLEHSVPTRVRHTAWTGIFLLHAGALALGVFVLEGQHSFFWFPLGLLAVWLYMSRALRLTALGLPRQP